MPRPRKLRPASANIAPGTPSVMFTMTGVRALRTRCTATMCPVLAPMARAARTSSVSFRESTWPRTSRGDADPAGQGHGDDDVHEAGAQHDHQENVEEEGRE